MHHVKYTFIGITRSEKNCRKRIAMSTSQQNVPRIVFMQIRAAIIDKSIFYYISASIADIRQNKMYRPMLLGSATIIKLLLT